MIINKNAKVLTVKLPRTSLLKLLLTIFMMPIICLDRDR
jgi:hypothetical protein